MSSASSDFFYGWDLLYKTIEKVVNKKDDLLIALAHFVLTKHSQFKCIGIGDDKTLSEEDEDCGSELLPDNWNDDENNYALRYTHYKQLYILLALKTEGSLIITLLDVKSRKVSNIALDPEGLVMAIKGSVTKMIPTASQLAERYRKELVEPMFAGTASTTATTVTTQTVEISPITSVTAPESFLLRRATSRPQQPPPFGFPVGRGDLDPLGRGGPGNLFPLPSPPDFRFGPDNGPGFGPGARPRFDPFGPPERDIRPNPNPDHMQPPRFGDDYYYM